MVKRWIFACSFCLACMSSAEAVQPPRQFVRGSQQQIVSAHAGKPFVVSFWSLDCTYCVDELAMFGKLRTKFPGVDIVLVSIDAPARASEAAAMLERNALGNAQSWIVADSHIGKLIQEIDPAWYGELPRTYFHSARDGVRGVSGKLDEAVVERWMARQLQTR